MKFGLRRLISFMLLFAWLSTLFASGLPEDSNSERNDLMQSVQADTKAGVWRLVRYFGPQLPIDPTTAGGMVELFRVTGGY